METDRHRCKLCSRTFGNGRALGGHMKAHLASPRPTPHIPTSYDENPGESVKFSFSASGGDSEAESKVGKRRSGRIVGGDEDSESPEAEPVNSATETSPEEDVAMCLVMLSRDGGLRSPAKRGREIGVADMSTQKKHQCEICKKSFRSSQALGGHRIIHRKKVAVAVSEERIVAKNKHKSFGSSRNLNDDRDDEDGYVDESIRIFECPFCGKVFGSGQALGGHKRSHLMGGFGRSSSSSSVVEVGWEKTTLETNVGSFIDLNMPAPVEDEDVHSVVSDDGGGPAHH